MMEHIGTVMVALDLLHVPSRARLIRSAPLPDGVVTLLRIADGNEALTRQAAVATGASPAMIQRSRGLLHRAGAASSGGRCLSRPRHRTGG